MLFENAEKLRQCFWFLKKWSVILAPRECCRRFPGGVAPSGQTIWPLAAHLEETGPTRDSSRRGDKLPQTLLNLDCDEDDFSAAKFTQNFLSFLSS